MTNGLPEVPENFYWEVTKPYTISSGFSMSRLPALVRLVEHLDVGEWEELPPYEIFPMGYGTTRDQYTTELYDFAIQPRGWKKPPPLEPTTDIERATHVRKNSKHIRRSEELSDRWDQEELIRVAKDVIDLYHIRAVQSEMYGTYPPKSL